MVGDIKHIFVIQSLFEGDVKSGQELYDDTIKRGIEYFQPNDIRIKHKFFNAPTKKSFVEYLKFISENAYLMSDGLLLHLEMHGSANRDGLVCSDKSLITWIELIDLFRVINIQCNNALYISLASCFGRDLFNGTNPELKSPYSGYISASKEVLPDEILQNFSSMFEILIKKGNVITAYLEASTPDSSFFYKDAKETFIQSFEYVKRRLYNDPEFKRMALGPELYDSIDATGGYGKEELVELMMEQALNEIYGKQKEAFYFNN
ncbi:MAG: hypothetical protein EOO91_01945 [Pedobacter sp.]|nr:MAG: hypothetical protein EOO91_01945 [Pedobacter sp.]